MENATKALMIAAAILVAIIIISLGLAVVNKGRESVSNADLSEAELAAFNSKFTGYEGTNKSTADVNALFTTVFSHNQTEGEGNTVTVKDGEGDDAETLLDADYKKIPKKTGSDRYTVECKYENGLVSTIIVKSNSDADDGE